MSIIAPTGRKHLSADALMSAFAMFSLKSSSLLAFDQERTEGNLETIYRIKRVPRDTYMREVLDPISPASLRPSFKGVFRQLQRGKALEAMTFLDGHYLVALDGTEYFSDSLVSSGKHNCYNANHLHLSFAASEC